MVYFLNLYKNITGLNPLYVLCFVSLFFRAEIHCFLNVIWYCELKYAVAVAGETTVTDCKTLFVSSSIRNKWFKKLH